MLKFKKKWDFTGRDTSYSIEQAVEHGVDEGREGQMENIVATLDTMGKVLGALAAQLPEAAQRKLADDLGFEVIEEPLLCHRCLKPLPRGPHAAYGLVAGYKVHTKCDAASEADRQRWHETGETPA